MSSNKALTVLAASGLLALLSLAPVYAQTIPEMEQNELTNSDSPDVDPGASRGPDAPIVDQERMQLGNSPEPDVPMGSGAATKGGSSIPDLEKQDIED